MDRQTIGGFMADFNREATIAAMKRLRIQSLINKAQRYEKSAVTYAKMGGESGGKGR
jgi:hypothetical protein